MFGIPSGGAGQEKRPLRGATGVSKTDRGGKSGDLRVAKDRSETALVFLKEKTNRRPPGWDRAEPADGSCVTPAGLPGYAKRDKHQKEDDPYEVEHLSVHFSFLLSVPTQPARTPRVDDDP